MAKSRPGQKQIVDSTADIEFTFEGTDFRGRAVSLLTERWESKILQAHPDLKGYVNAVERTALDPDIVLEEYNIQDVEIHASYDRGTGIYSGKYLWVPIRYKMERGEVLTAYWLRDLKDRKYRKYRISEWRRK